VVWTSAAGRTWASPRLDFRMASHCCFPDSIGSQLSRARPDGTDALSEYLTVATESAAAVRWLERKARTLPRDAYLWIFHWMSQIECSCGARLQEIDLY